MTGVGDMAGPGAMVTCNPLCCPEWIMNATSAAASASLSCLSKIIIWKLASFFLTNLKAFNLYCGT